MFIYKLLFSTADSEHKYSSNVRSRRGPENAYFIRQVSLLVDFRYFAT